MCQNCNNSNCGGCSQPCAQFPPPPGPPGQVGPIGPQGPAGPCPCPINLVKLVGPTSYIMLGTDDVVLCDTRVGIVNIQLLPANNTLVINRKITIKDAYGSAAINDILITPIIGDTVDGISVATSLNVTVGNYGSITMVTDQLTMYNII